MGLVQRLLGVTFQLGTGTFGTTGSNTVALPSLRVSAKVIKAGGPAMGTLQMAIYGMTLSLMNQLTTLGLLVTQQRRNYVTLTAGDAVAGMSTVFIGTITNAWADFQASPEVAFRVEAHTGLFEAIEPSPPLSFTGQMDVSTALAGLATKMGLAFQNSGVTTKLSNSYYYGSPRNQALAIVQDAGIEWNAMENGILAIWPRGKARNGLAPTISPSTGMIGYPAFTSKGIMVRTLYNPSIGFGQMINVESSIQTSLQAAQTGGVAPTTLGSTSWIVFSLDHDLDSMVPNGNWSTTIGASPPGQTVVQL